MRRDGSIFVNLIVWYAVFLFSTTLHEASHSYAAALAGDDTAYRAGSATLNPIPHMQRERFGMIIVPLITFFLNGGQWMIGWASAPFNPYWAARYPRRSFVMSLAGPLSHLLPILASGTVMAVGLHTGLFTIPEPMDRLIGLFPVASAEGAGAIAWPLAMLMNVTFQLNVVLLVFNLMPLPPLDGSEVWYLFMKKEEARLRWRYTANSYAFAGIMLAWYLFPRVFWPVLVFLVRQLYSFAW